ncbi:YfcE family phosphodiesterase [Staphylococcus felis]|uniref:YfcE family phosphodiesterase n=1 Tax=Staphylococcus felis TaxID=46127 RepID=UPI002480910C|nr:YfcE family phosphodiesterase [Staphylococcus felis]MDQ7192189.1 YfcE family phosphodiesterase [Staphylococcus felis]
MYKLIVVSDNHSEPGVLYDIYDKHDDADAYFHLGDSEFEYNDTELSLYKRVKGNMDFYLEFPESKIEQYGDIKVFITHGHLYGVNTSRENLAQQAANQHAQFAFYGHTHIARYEHIHNVHLINPGSISKSRSHIEETYCEVKIENKSAIINFRNRQHEIIKSIRIDVI